jgi:hypothetical protein
MLVFMAMGFLPLTVRADDWYVDWSQSNDDKDGHSWQSAKRTLKAALDASIQADGNNDNFFVKGSTTPGQAVYKPGSGSTSTFEMYGTRKFYGGSANATCDDLTSQAQLYVQLVSSYGGGAISTYRLSYFERLHSK